MPPVDGGLYCIEVAALVRRLAYAHALSVRSPTELVREELVAGDFHGLQHHIRISVVAHIETEDGRNCLEGGGVGDKVLVRIRRNALHARFAAYIAIWFEFLQRLRSALFEERRH